MEIKVNNQSKQVEVRVGEKLIRLDYNPTSEDTLVDCESICPLVKNGLNCEKLRHPENPSKSFSDFCSNVSVDLDLSTDLVPNYEDVMKFYTQEEIENASGYIPEIVEDWKAWLEKED